MSSGRSTAPGSRLNELPGVRRLWIGTPRDAPSAEGAAEVDAAQIVRAAAMLRELAQAGDLLGFGPPSCISSRDAATTWLIASRGDRLLLVDVDPAQPLAAIEAAVVELAWPSPSPSPPGDAPADLASPSPTVEPPRRGSVRAAVHARVTAASATTPGPRPAAPSRAGPTLIPRIAEASRPVQASVFAGTLQTFCLPDLLDFLRNGRKTGTLVCTSVAGIGAIRLYAGKITDASAPATPQLVDVLIQRLVISRAQANFPDGSNDSEPQRRFASKLVRDGRATAAQVQAAARARIYQAVEELLAWTEGEFSFDPTALREPADLEMTAVQIDSQAVLLEIFARLDESDATR